MSDAFTDPGVVGWMTIRKKKKVMMCLYIHGDLIVEFTNMYLIVTVTYVYC